MAKVQPTRIQYSPPHHIPNTLQLLMQAPRGNGAKAKRFCTAKTTFKVVSDKKKTSTNIHFIVYFCFENAKQCKSAVRCHTCFLIVFHNPLDACWGQQQFSQEEEKGQTQPASPQEKQQLQIMSLNIRAGHATTLPRQLLVIAISQYLGCGYSF